MIVQVELTPQQVTWLERSPSGLLTPIELLVRAAVRANNNQKEEQS